MNQVIKNNGKRVEFKLDKIKKAIEKANNVLDNPLQEDDINYIVNKSLAKLQKINRDVNTDEISDIVEEAISKVNFSVAREYIEGRYRKREAREKSTIDAKIQEVLDDGEDESLRAAEIFQDLQKNGVDERKIINRLLSRGFSYSVCVMQYRCEFVGLGLCHSGISEQA